MARRVEEVARMGEDCSKSGRARKAERCGGGMLAGG